MEKKPLSLTEDPIPQLTWRIAVPVSVGMFFNTMFNFVDTYCAGLLGTDALAALSLSFPLFFLLIAVGSGLSQGTTALMANALGAGDRAGARVIFAQSLLFAVISGILISGLGLGFAPLIFRSLGAEGIYFSMTLEYMNVILGGGLFFILTMAINASLQAQGETRVYRNFLIGGFLMNCALNPLLMWGFWKVPAMGVSGIALATVLVQIVGTGLLWRESQKKELCRDISISMFRPNPLVLKQIIGQSVPSALNMITIALGVFVLTWFIQHEGKEVVAASGIATRIEQIVLLPVIGLSSAVLSIVGQNHGAGFRHRVREAWLFNLKRGALLMVGGGVLVTLFGGYGMRLFTSDAAVIQHGKNYLSVAALTLPAYPILFVTVFMMQGLKRPAYGLWIGLYRQVVAPMIVYHLLSVTFGWGLWGVWWGVFLVTWSAALFAIGWGWRAVRD